MEEIEGGGKMLRRRFVMKKLLVLLLVLGFCTAAQATIAWRVNPEDAKDHYTESDVITIELWTDLNMGYFDCSAVCDGGAGGTAQAPLVVNAGFGGYADTGTIVNGEVNGYDILIEWMSGSVGSGQPYVTGALYSFEYHVPDVEASTEITIGTNEDETGWAWCDMQDDQAIDYDINDVSDLVIHVVPEPMTMVLLGLGGLALLRRRR
jgi:hypothetical protein